MAGVVAFLRRRERAIPRLTTWGQPRPRPPLGRRPYLVLCCPLVGTWSTRPLVGNGLHLGRTQPLVPPLLAGVSVPTSAARGEGSMAPSWEGADGTGRR